MSYDHCSDTKRYLPPHNLSFQSFSSQITEKMNVIPFCLIIRMLSLDFWYRCKSSRRFFILRITDRLWNSFVELSDISQVDIISNNFSASAYFGHQIFINILEIFRLPKAVAFKET